MSNWLADSSDSLRHFFTPTNIIITSLASALILTIIATLSCCIGRKCCFKQERRIRNGPAPMPMVPVRSPQNSTQLTQIDEYHVKTYPDTILSSQYELTESYLQPNLAANHFESQRSVDRDIDHASRIELGEIFRCSSPAFESNAVRTSYQLPEHPPNPQREVPVGYYPSWEREYGNNGFGSC